MSWEDLFVGIGLVVLAIAGVLFLIGAWLFQIVTIVLMAIVKHFKWVALGASAVAVAWIVTQ